MLRRSAILHIIGDVVAPTTAHRRAGALAATATAGAASCSDSSACTARCSPRAGSGILESGTGRDLDRRLLGSHMSTQQGHAGASGRRLKSQHRCRVATTGSTRTRSAEAAAAGSHSASGAAPLGMPPARSTADAIPAVVPNLGPASSRAGGVMLGEALPPPSPRVGRASDEALRRRRPTTLAVARVWLSARGRRVIARRRRLGGR
jgi:hypothetical protein